MSNRFGIGNRVKLTISEADTLRTIHRSVTTGGSFGSSALQMEVGLGNADEITDDRSDLAASGIVQQFNNAEMNRFYLVRETEDELIVNERKRFQFQDIPAIASTLDLRIFD
jgi:hypothetical protein